MKARHDFDHLSLKNGQMMDLRRPRSEGLLSQHELDVCRNANLPVAFDPAQQGWVLMSFEDDIDPWSEADREPVLRASEGQAQGSATVTQLKPAEGASAAATELRFRAWQSSDLSVFRALLDDPEVWELLPEPYPAPLTAELAATLIELSNGADHHEVRAVLADGEPVGQVRVAFGTGDADETEVEISYWLGRAYWGRGLGARMVAQYVADIRDRMPSVESLVARIHHTNDASARIAQKAGFHLAGVAEDDPDIRIYRLDLRAASAGQVA